eukprot:Gb_30228 [translate_table: standard]
MPYSSTTRHNVGRRARDRLSTTEVDEVRQHRHDRYVRQRHEETLEQRVERNRRRRETYHQRRGRGATRMVHMHPISDILQRAPEISSIQEEEQDGSYNILNARNVFEINSNISDVLRGDEGHVDHGGDEDLPLVPTTIVSQPLEGATTTSHRSISNQYDEMGGGFPPDDEGNGAFINVDCCVMPCPTQKNHHDMMLPIDDEHVELPSIGVDVLNGAQSPLTHNDINEITPSLVEKEQRFVQGVREDVGMAKRQPRIILRSAGCVPDQATTKNSYGLGQDLNGSERLSTKMGVPPMSSRMEEIMPMLDGVIPETLCSVGREEIMEETSRHNNIDHENHEQHTNTVQKTHIVDGLAQFDREGPKCSRCKHEKHGNRFSLSNNMDSGDQPFVLRILTQVEEMLIARVSPILQVSHAPGGQYKYRGHTISFPQDIYGIEKSLPRHIEKLDILIVRRKGEEGRNYDCIVKRSRVMNALLFKIQHDKYYADVEIDEQAMLLLPEHPMDVSSLLSTIEVDIEDASDRRQHIHDDSRQEYGRVPCHPTSFTSRPPNTLHDMEQIREWLENPGANTKEVVDWPDIDSSPLNEYNTEGIFDMAFPTLFPTGDAEWLQPRIRNVRLYEYARHFMRYYDHRFLKHPRFRYFVMNMIMCHRSQGTTAIFIKRNAEERLPATIEELRYHLDTLPDARLAERVMRFGTTLRGTRAYWNKCRSELTDLVHQIGCPTIFFTLSAADMQWPDLHRLMPGTSPNDPCAAQQWWYKNVIDYPHIVAAYMHQRHTLFREEVLTKFHGAVEFWSRYEWQHRGSPHVHGFHWLDGAPDMDALHWDDPYQVLEAKHFFDTIMHAWNPREPHQRNIQVHRSLLDDPCLLDTRKIFEREARKDYEELVNHVEQHTKCNEGSCLRKKGRSLVCRYNAPWELRSESTLFIDENGQKKYEPKQNDDRVNVHNRELLLMWRVRTCEDALESGNTLIDVYINRPSMLDDLPLIEVARSWTHNPRRKGDPWRPRERAAIVRVWSRFHTIPSEDSESFQEFCWSELLLYKPFRSFQTDIGLLKEQIIQNWHNMRYNAWHVNRSPTEANCDIAEDEDNLESPREVQERHEWEIFSTLAHPRFIPFTDVDMLDEMRRANNLSVDVSIPPNVLTLGNRQHSAFEIIMQHYASGSLSEPLKLIIQAFLEKKHQPFGGRSMILIGDLGQLPPVMDKPFWEFLMARIDTFLGSEEIKMFRNGVHLYTTNSSVRGNNRDRLKSLNIPIARSITEKLKKSYALGPDDDQLELEVLVAIGARVMLTSNLWTDVGLVNGALGTVRQIVYAQVMPMSIPIVPITRGQRRQLPWRLAWALIIHKSQGLTLNQATVDIGNVERQGMVFTAISRVRDIKSLRISPPFTFERYARMSDSAYVTIRKKEEKRLQMLSI